MTTVTQVDATAPVEAQVTGRPARSIVWHLAHVAGTEAYGVRGGHQARRSAGADTAAALPRAAMRWPARDERLITDWEIRALLMRGDDDHVR